MIFGYKNKIILIKRGVEPYKGHWGLPGGYVEWDQTVEQAVIREVKEETNLETDSLKLIGVYSSPNRHPKQAINLAYLVSAKGKLKHGDDAIDAKWFNVNSLPENLAFDHRDIIHDASGLLTADNKDMSA